MPFRNEFLLRLPGMHQNHVGTAAAREVERLAGSQGNDFNVDAGLGLEQRQDAAEQAGVLRRSSGGDHDGFVLRRSERYLRKGKGNHKREISHSGGALIEWSSWNIQSWSEPLPFFIQPLGSLGTPLAVAPRTLDQNSFS